MKLYPIIAVLFISVFLASCGGETKDSGKKEPIKESSAQLMANRIEVIDFYGTRRCKTCIAIEKNTKYTLDTYFADEMKEGRVVFKMIDVDKEENYGIAEEYLATSTALFLNVVKGDKSSKIDLTKNAFENGRDQAVFSDELKFFIDNELQAL